MKSLRKVLVLVVACPLLISSPPAARAADATGRIAYARSGDIHTIAADGTGDRRLTRTGDAGHPRWSPDGSQLAFVRQDDIHVMGADGTGVRRVTYSGRTSQPAWSPDGSQFVAVRRHGAHTDLYRLGARRGTYPARLTDVARLGCDVEHPDWRGQHIVFVRHCPPPDGNGRAVSQLRLLHVGTGTESVVLDTARSGGRLGRPAFTARGDVMFLGCVPAPPWGCTPGSSVYVVDVDGTGVRELLHGSSVDGDDNYTSAAPNRVDGPFVDWFVVEWSASSGDEQDDRSYEGLRMCGAACHELISTREATIDDPDWQPVRD